MRSVSKLIILSAVVFISTAFFFAVDVSAQKRTLTRAAVSSGIRDDNLTDINRFLETSGLPEIDNEYFFYHGISFATSNLFLLDNPAPNTMWSIDFRFPYSRRTGSSSSVDLKTYSFYIETKSAQYYDHYVSLHSIVGLGLSSSYLKIDKVDANNLLYNEFGNKSNLEFSKFTATLNLGGGLDFRVPLNSEKNNKISLLLGFSVRYAIPLDAFGIYEKNWQLDDRPTDLIPEYSDTGIAIEFNIGIEIHKYEPEEE